MGAVDDGLKLYHRHSGEQPLQGSILGLHRGLRHFWAAAASLIGTRQIAALEGTVEVHFETCTAALRRRPTIG